jgi:hypothetical protein
VIDPKREICGVSEVTLEFKKNLRKDAALNEYNKDSGVVVEQKCVCVWWWGLGEDRTEKCDGEGGQDLVENRKVCVCGEGMRGGIRIGPNSGRHAFKNMSLCQIQ